MRNRSDQLHADERGGRRKRGSALVITVGTLALVAVIAAFYVTLGQADTRVAQTVERGQNIEAIVAQVAEHIAAPIGLDRLAVHPDTITNHEDAVGAGFDSAGNPVNATAADRQRFVREATDYPYTDYSYKSVIVPDPTIFGEGDIAFVPDDYLNMPGNLVFQPGDRFNLADAAERYRFRPAGDHPVMLDLPDGLGLPGTGDSLDLAKSVEALRDYRVASDPWLASAEPTFTGLGDPDGNPNTYPAERRVFSEDGLERNPIGAATLDEFTYLDNRDWAQISNLAPDGLFVNLWNLRGNFDAESGLGTAEDGRLRMSENRTLLTLVMDSPANPDPETDFRIRASDRLHIDPDGDIATSILDRNDSRAFAIRNTPAWWTMNQRFLYFPADPAFEILGRADETVTNLDSATLVPQTWGTPDYPEYQYADADGDGFYDSRWFELTDSTLGFFGSRSLIENDTDMRFFVAARVIDLSARVNVNAATDGLVPPTSDVPMGATPAEIDLRRLLTMQDAGERFRPVFENVDLGVDDQRLSYAHVERLPFESRQTNNPGRLVAEDYEGYLASEAPTTTFIPDRVNILQGPSLRAGRFAYDALRREIQGDALYLPSMANNLGSPTDGDSVYELPLSDGSPFEYFDFDPTVSSPALPPQDEFLYPVSLVNGSDVVFGTWAVGNRHHDQIRRLPEWRRDSWFDIGGVNIADADDLAETRGGLGGRLFGVDDLTELLTFNGANDDSTLSRLERVTQGRYDAGADAVDVSTLRYGPLRANRPTSLERAGHDVRLNDQAPDSNQFPDNLVDDEVFALNALNPRLRLTTISGAAPLRSRVVEDLDRDGVLSDDERRLTALDARLSLMPSAVIVNDATTGGATDLGVLAPDTFTRNTAAQSSFIADGFRPGMVIITRGFANPENNGRFVITDVRDREIDVRADTLVTETQANGREIAEASPAERPEVLFQYYADALAPYAEADATWNNNPEGDDPAGSLTQPDFPSMRTLAYGYRGSELALRLSAHLSVNMADMYDADDEPSASTVLANGDLTFRRQITEDLVANQGVNTPYHWWNDNKRLDLGENNLAPGNDDLNEDYSRLAYNTYGVEPQPFITEVSVITIFSDVPQQRIIDQIGPSNGFGGAVMGTGPDGESVGDIAGHNERQLADFEDFDDADPKHDDGEQDDVTVRVDISPENPDLVAHVLAIQLTNPFDVPINLSGDDTTPNGQTLDGGALNSTDPLRLESAKFYIEYNGHFFPLAEYFEREPEINPATGGQYAVLRPNEAARAANRLYPVTLQPGESRVFYVSAHPSVLEMNTRWRSIDAVYDHNGYQGVFAPDLLNRDSRNLFEEFIAAQFTVTDDDGRPVHLDVLSADTEMTPGDPYRADPRAPVRLVPFNPLTGALAVAGQSYASGGTFTDFQRTSIAVRNPANIEGWNRMRQEVRLWRRMTVDDDTPFADQEHETYSNGGSNNGENWLQNDLLADRLRDPILPTQDTTGQRLATLDFTAFDRARVNFQNTGGLPDLDPNRFYTTLTGTLPDWQTPTQIFIRNTTVAPENTPNPTWSNTSQGLTFTRLAGYRRPDHLTTNPGGDEDPVSVALRGLLPAWALESREMNYNIAIPTVEGLDLDENNDDIPDFSGLVQQGQTPPAVLGPVSIADAVQEAITDAETETDPGAFAGEGGGFLFGFRSFSGETNPVPGQVPESDFVRSLRYLMDKTLPDTEPNAEQSTYVIGVETAIVPTIRRHPDDKDDVHEDGDRANDFLDVITELDSAADGFDFDPAHTPILSTVDGFTPTLLNSQERDAGFLPVPVNETQSLLVNNSDRFGFDGDEPRTTRIRLGDILMPLAVGPTFAPRLAPVGSHVDPWGWTTPSNFRPGDWTTLAEALAAALGVEPPVFYNKDPDSQGYSLLSELVERRGESGIPSTWDVEVPVGPRSLTNNVLTVQDGRIEAQVEFVLDRGRLHLREYSPFVNGNDVYMDLAFGNPFGIKPKQKETASVTFTPTDPVVAGDNVDYRVAFSVPPAQRLLSMTQAVLRGGDLLTFPVIGTVNINTATDPVLRTLPGLATSLQFSESRVDYDQYDIEDISSPEVLGSQANPLMEWASGRVAAKYPYFSWQSGQLPQQDRPLRLGVGDPFHVQINQSFPTDEGWRSVAEISPALTAFRDRTQSSFRSAAKRTLGGGGGGPPVPASLGDLPTIESIYDFTSFFSESNPFSASLPEYAFSDGVFDPSSNAESARLRDIIVTNYTRDFSRAGINGQIPSSEQPGLDGLGSILGLALASNEPLTRREAKIRPENVFAESPRLRDLQSGATWTVHVYEEGQHGTFGKYANDWVSPDRSDSEPLPLVAIDQDFNKTLDPNGDGTALAWNVVGDGVDPVSDPITDDNYSFTLGRAFFGNGNPDEASRPRVLEDELANDILEELAILNGAANTMDTRSDFFAAWFVLRGYTESDVTGLDPAEPMTPTFQKRFLMILDRSNVTEAGQSPKVLIFREVPL